MDKSPDITDANRFSRHLFDLVEISNSSFYSEILSNRDICHEVAEHKSKFYKKNNTLDDGSKEEICYFKAVNGELKLLPEGQRLQRLKDDYLKMLDARLIIDGTDFETLINSIRAIQDQLNEIANKYNDHTVLAGED
jgi:hypothetical protein